MTRRFPTQFVHVKAVQVGAVRSFSQRAMDSAHFARESTSAGLFGRNSERHNRCAASRHVRYISNDRYDVVPHLWTAGRSGIR
jgi:hypothetical protein